MSEEIFSRTERLLGPQAMEELARLRVILFGVGGVGSWCAESLVRSGVGHLTIVDSDVVCATNVNRQLMATTKTVGRPKVEALRERLLDINPAADIVARQEIYSAETAGEFRLEEYDYVIDAIDTLQHKAALILHACATPATLLSSMGAALKIDPQRIRVAEFWKAKGCPLARALRNRFKRLQTLPQKKFRCVFSDELLPNQPLPAEAQAEGTEQWAAAKAQVNGTVVHAVAIFGLTLAGLVIQDVYSKTNQ